MNPPDYTPVFDDTVREFFPNYPGLGMWTINKMYCLTPASAVILASLFNPKPQIIMSTPFATAGGSPFGFSHLVPWFKFANGTLRNAAVLASYWTMPGFPIDRALEFAILDVQTWVPGDPQSE